jgi:hypothetical protein
MIEYKLFMVFALVITQTYLTPSPSKIDKEDFQREIDNIHTFYLFQD